MNIQIELIIFLLVLISIVIPIHVMWRRARDNKIITKPVYHLVGFITATIIFGCIWAAVGYFNHIPGSLRLYSILGAMSSTVFTILSLAIERLRAGPGIEESDDDEEPFDD